MAFILDWLKSQLLFDEMRIQHPNLTYIEVQGDVNALSAECLFQKEWDKVGHLYSHYLEQNPDRIGRMLEFFEQVATSENAPQLRPGTSMWNLILSRARRHGLKAAQKRMSFDFSAIQDGQVEVGHNLHGEWQSFIVTEFNTRVEALMAELAAIEID